MSDYSFVKGEKWTNPAGIKDYRDDEDGNGFNLTDMVNSALWFQNEFGELGKSLSSSDMSSHADGLKDGPPNHLWVNLPVIDYDKMHPVGKDSMAYYGQFNKPLVSKLFFWMHARVILNY